MFHFSPAGYQTLNFPLLFNNYNLLKKFLFQKTRSLMRSNQLLLTQPSSGTPYGAPYVIRCMITKKPFITRNKPKSWVVCICAGLIGMAIGLIGFIFAWLGFKTIQAITIGFFVFCLFTFATSWLVFAFRLVSGRYINLQSKPWSEQIW